MTWDVMVSVSAALSFFEFVALPFFAAAFFFFGRAK